MGKAGKWLITIVIALVVFGAVTWACYLWVPLEVADRIVIGASAGVVVGAIIGLWGASVVDNAVSSREAGEASPPGSGVRQKVDSGQGININAPGRTSFKNSPITINQPPTPSGDAAAAPGAGVVRPKVIRLGEIPREPPGYQPRTDLLNQLNDAGGSSSLSVVRAIKGMRGVGKTHLAAAYARKRIQDGWPIVAWLNGENPDQLVTGLAELADQLGLRQPDQDALTAAKAARNWLQTTSESALLVIENAEDPTAIDPWIPVGGTTHVVITTTRQGFSTTADTIDVTVFTEAQAVHYLQDRTGLDDSTGAATVAAELGCLPLALGQAAWTITNQGHTFTSYLDRLRTVPLARTLQATGAYPRGTAEAILLSAQHAQQAGPAATGTLLDVLAFLSPTGVPRTLLPHLLPDAPPGEIDQALGTLADASLIAYSVDRTTVITHRLTQHALRDRTKAIGTLDETVTATIAALDTLTVPEEQAWPRRAEAGQLIDQITALTDHTTANLSHHGEPAPWAEKVIGLRTWALRHLIAVTDYTQAITHARNLLHDTATLHSIENEDTLYLRDCLATAHQNAGHHQQAIDIFETVLTDHEHVFGADHSETLTARHNLANAYRAAGRLREATTHYQTVLTNCEHVVGTDHLISLTTRHNLARAYQDSGRHDESTTHFEAALADCERVLGTDHPLTLATRHNLAVAYHAAGRLGEAIARFEVALADCERVLGTDHPDTLTTCHNLASAYHAAGRLGEAIAHYEATLTDQERVLGPDHPHTLTTRLNLAALMRKHVRLQWRRWFKRLCCRTP